MSKCEICGEPMPAGEEMFNYHGYSGPCPKPPLTRDDGAEAVKAGTNLSAGLGANNEEEIMGNNRKKDLEDYCKAMRSGDGELCFYIEQRHGLDGYPPEIVTTALTAASQGKDMQSAIDGYMSA